MLPTFLAYIRHLERDGELLALMETPEGRAAAETWSRVAEQVQQQIAVGARQGEPAVDLTVAMPRASARETITFVRVLLKRAVTSGAMDQADADIAEGYVEQADVALLLQQV